MWGTKFTNFGNVNRKPLEGLNAQTYNEFTVVTHACTSGSLGNILTHFSFGSELFCL